jgi:hypothetical protein
MNLARLETAQKKLREAEHFLSMMRSQEAVMRRRSSATVPSAEMRIAENPARLADAAHLHQW